MKLIIVAVLLVALVLGVQIAAGGGDFKPRAPADPCVARAVPPIPAELEALAERLVLSALDEAACTLGVSRERLVLDLAEGEDVDPEVLRAGLARGVDRLEDLPPVSAVLPEALALADLPAFVQDAAEAIPDSVVDDLLPTRELLERAIAELDVEAVLDDLEDPGALEPVLRDAILNAAGDQLLDALRDVVG